MHPSSSLLRPTCLGVLAIAACLAAEPGPRPAPDSPEAKIGSDLWPYLGGTQPVDRQLRARSVPASRPELVRLELDVPVTDANLAAIRGTGATIIETTARWNAVAVEATPAQARALAGIAAVDLVSLALRPRVRSFAVGSYDNEADPVLRSDAFRSAWGVDGTGMRIGVMSDSINVLDPGTIANGAITGMASQVSGDLPASIPYIALKTSYDNTDEGAGMIEEVHHLASGAVCVFSSCGDTQTAMASNIGKFASVGHCQVACDDIGFDSEPMFQDGPIAQAADAFVAGGGIYLSSAGNSGTTGILQPYVDVNAGASDPHGSVDPDGSDFHDWGHGTSNGMLPLLVPDGATLKVVLQWNQPYKSYNLGQGAQSDFDLILYEGPNPATAGIIDYGGDIQGTAGHPKNNPFEYAIYDNTSGSAQTVWLAVDWYQGIKTGIVMRLSLDLSYADSLVTSTAAGIFNCGTSYGHPAAATVLGIGAVDASTPDDLEFFSSAGGWGSWDGSSAFSYNGLPFYFTSSGAAIAGGLQTRNKPDLIAPDGVTTNWSSPDAFYGTSSAAPHAAAVAALVWAAKPSLSNTAVIQALRDGAVDLANAPATAGNDAFAGGGRVDAMAALGTAVTGVTSASASGTYLSGSIPISITFSQPVDVTGTPVLHLNTTPAESAVFTGGTGTTTLVFTYTIAAGDDCSLLESDGTGALELAGGATIDDHASGDPADLVLPTPGAARSLSAAKSIAIEAHGAGLTITASPANSHHPDIGFTFRFSHAVIGFAGSMITWTNATATPLATTDNITWTTTATATAHGQVIADVAPAVVVDSAGYDNLPASGTATYSAAAAAGGGSGGCGLGGAGILLGVPFLLIRLRRRR